MANNTALQAELASRILSRRRLLPFTQRMNPKYNAGWVHEDICRRLERFSDDVAAGKSPRLMLLMPPRHGKSELASRSFPPWHMGRHPDHEFIACSYNVSLAMGFSRKVKQIIDDPNYQSVFDVRLDPKNQSAEEWALEGTRGGYVAAGIGGPITGKGAHCLHRRTNVSTVGGSFSLERLYQLQCIPDVLTPAGPRRVMAITKRPAPHIYVLRFASGAVLRATWEHPVYLPDQARYATVGEIYGSTQSDGEFGLRVVREVVSAPAVRPRQVGEARLDGVLLRQGVQPGAPCGEERQAVPDMRPTRHGVGEEPERFVLLGHVQAESGAPRPQDLPAVFRGVSAETFKAGLLRGELRRYGPCDPYAWGGELELAHGQRIRLLVRPDEADDIGQGQGVPCMRHGDEPALPPSGRGPEQQFPREPGDAVCCAPHGAPQICYDTLSMVERDGEVADFVYDLQVEEAGCFFADGVLVGNCLVIDDPIKNAEEADSAEAREKIWEWYLSTAYTRLAPGGGVLVIQTWWHDDDLAGRLQAMMSSPDEEDAEYIDQFEVIRYPAIAESDEYLDNATQLIVDEPPEDGVLLRRKGEALHPARYDVKKLMRIKTQNKGGRWWSALYQQNPVPDDGAYFLKEHFRRAALPPIHRCNVAIAWDFAISEKKQNDYTVGTVTLQDDDDVLHVAEQVRFKSGDGLFIVEAILNLSKKWYSPGLQLGFEDGQIYRAIETLLKKRMKERREYPSITVLKPITDKMARARPLQGRMQQGMVSFADRGEWYDPCRLEMLRFPAGVHDDCVDSLSWAVQMAIGRQPPQKPKTKEPASWRDKLKKLGGRGSHMAA